jgi:hypothetical protein
MAKELEEKARILINGVLLSELETMTLRVALGSFMIELEGDLCKDSTELMSMTVAYRTHAGAIARKLCDLSRNAQHNDRCPAREECNADKVCIYRCGIEGKEAALVRYNRIWNKP